MSDEGDGEYGTRAEGTVALDENLRPQLVGLVRDAFESALDSLADDECIAKGRRASRFALYRSLRIFRGSLDRLCSSFLAFWSEPHPEECRSTLPLAFLSPDARSHLLLIAYRRRLEKEAAERIDGATTAGCPQRGASRGRACGAFFRIADAYMRALDQLKLEKEVAYVALRCFLGTVHARRVALAGSGTSGASPSLEDPTLRPDTSFGRTPELIEALFDEVEQLVGFVADLTPMFRALRCVYVELSRSGCPMLEVKDSGPRRLLEALIQAAQSVRADTRRADVVQACREVIEEVLRSPDERAPVYATGPHRVISVLRAGHRPLPSSAAEVRPRFNEAWRRVAADVRANLVAVDLPVPVVDVLRTHWTRAMIAAAVGHGFDSSEYRACSHVAEEIVCIFRDWNLRPRSERSGDSEARNRLAALRDVFRTALADAGLSSARVEKTWLSLCDLLPDPRFEPITEDCRRGTRSATSSGADADSNLVPETFGLRVGETVSWSKPGATPLRLKLCWKSSVSGWHVFVTFQGEKALEVSGTVLKRMLDDGTLQRAPGWRDVH